MEIEGVKRIVVGLNTSQKIIGFVHDQDAKTSNYIRQHWSITEYMDTIHANKSFLRYFDDFQVGNTPPNGEAILKSLKKNIESYRNFCWCIQIFPGRGRTCS